MESDYCVANHGFDFYEESTGQSFTPSDLGPDGSGTPGTDKVKLDSFVVGFPWYALQGRSERCYIYNAPLDDPANVGQGHGLVAMSSSFLDEVDVLGPGSFSRRYQIDPIDCMPLDVNGTFYLYFAEPQIVRCLSGSVYGGGTAFGYDGDAEPDITLQFEADLYYEA